jgi:hypothetical protein
MNFKQKGRLIINNNPAAGRASDNVSLRTPFLPDVKVGENLTIFQYMKEIHDLGISARGGESFYNLSFYDEQRFDFEDDFFKYVAGRALPDKIYLGEPSFVLKNPDGEKWLRMELEVESNENVLIVSPMKKNRERYLRELLYNFVVMEERAGRGECGPVSFTVLYSDRTLFESVGFGRLKKCSSFQFRDWGSGAVTQMKSAFWRKLMIECDEKAFVSDVVSEEIVKEFESFLSQGKVSGELWLRRAQVLFDLLKTPSYQNAFGLKGLGKEDATKVMRGVVVAVFDQFIAYGFETKKISLSAFDTKFVVVVGLESIIGLGVDSRSSNVDVLKGFIRESSEYNVHFVVSAANIDDTYSLRTVFNHVICSDLFSSTISQLKIADEYPDTCASILGIYYDATRESDKCRKFKKMKFNGEI